MRKEKIEEQAAIVKEYEQWKEKELEKERKRMHGRIEYKNDLDQVIADRNTKEEEMKCQEKIEDEERAMFSEAKKVRSTKLQQ